MPNAEQKKSMVLRVLDVNRKKGIVKIVPETYDDFWHLYNVIHRNDRVFARTTREVKVDQRYSRPKRGERIPVFLGVKVTNVYWDRFLGILRITGTICESPDTVPTGAHHTMKIRLNMPITIVKKQWYEHQIERLKRASKTSEKPVIITSIDDEGYAIATTTQYCVEDKVGIRIRLPGKLEADKRSAAINEYFREAANSLRQVWMKIRSPIIVIGVGFIKNDFVRFIRKEADDIARSIVDVKSVNNSGIAGIYEALRSGLLLKTMKHLRIVEETNAVEEILKRLGKSQRNVTYGLLEVERATESGAVERILVANTMIREADEKRRLIIEQIMKTVEQKGGTIMVVSSQHEAGIKLLGLGGIAALLRFPIH